MNDPQDQPFAPRLDMIETQWSMLRRAHLDEAGEDARNALVTRYSHAIRNYVARVMNDHHDAQDLAQEIVVRMLKGDFAGAEAERGRFRDLLKVATKNMVRNHWARQKVRKTVDHDLELQTEDPSTDVDARWSKCYRDNVLDIAWSRLEAYQTDQPSSHAFDVLKLRAGNPKFSSAELANQLSQDLGNDISAATFRQKLRRSRVRFAEFVVEELASGLSDPTPEHIHDELVALGLFAFIKDVLPAEWGGTA